MPTPEFSPARNTSLTCSCNGLFLHSRFDPQKEAERFVSGIAVDYIPNVIVITGPGISYTVPFFRQRWPDARCIAIQYSSAFSRYDSDFDQVFPCTPETDALTLSESLFGLLGEDTAFSTLFVSWTPSEKIWPDESTVAWQAIKAYMNKSRDVTGTRNYFNRRWLKNTVRFFSLVRHSATTVPVSKPVIVCASGPTLEPVLPLLQEHRDRYFLLALSSAVSPLAFHNLIPDAVLSTDGGWWATRHLSPLLTDSRLQTVPLWVTSEAAVPSELLQHHPVQYISYGDPLETWLLSAVEDRTQTIQPLRGIRNGTVSGTALSLALALTDRQVFFCGLDLQSRNGYQHIQPNCLEARDSMKDYRLAPEEHRSTPRTFSNGSLAVYRNWFATRSAEKMRRAFRVISEEDQQTNSQLGYLKDIPPARLAQLLSEEPAERLTFTETVTISPSGNQPVTNALRQLQAELSAASGTLAASPLVTAFLMSTALPEYLMANRNQNPEQIAVLYDKAESFMGELILLAEKLEGAAS